MAYEFDPGETRFTKALRRIARDELGGALTLARATEHDASPLHPMRRHVKKTRGLLRLVAPVFPGFERENAALREAAAGISALRDAEVMREGLDRIAAEAPEAVAEAARAMLAHMPAAEDSLDPRALARFAECIAEVQDRARNWDLEEEGWDALGPGLEATLEDARRRMKRAKKSRADEDFHRWRSRVKHHWYHTRLLAGLWPEMMVARAGAADRLGEMLGLHHDLAVLTRALPDHLEPDQVTALAAHLAREQARLETLSFTLGTRLFAERPAAVVERWGAWHDLACAEAKILH